MEIYTRVRDLPEQIKYHRLPPDTYIRVIIDSHESKDYNGKVLQKITHEEQKRILSLIPDEYDPGASEELTNIIGKSHVNTGFIDL